jgi:hypothetical protein
MVAPGEFYITYRAADGFVGQCPAAPKATWWEVRCTIVRVETARLHISVPGEEGVTMGTLTPLSSPPPPPP